MINDFFTSFSGNWVDLIILIVLFAYAVDGLHTGFWYGVSHLLSFVGSLVVALRFYSTVGLLLAKWFSLSHSLSIALGFIVVAFVVNFILDFVLHTFVQVVPHRIKHNVMAQALGVIPAVGRGFILVTILLLFAMALPIRPFLKSAISDSTIGSKLLVKGQVLESRLKTVFGGVIEESLTYLTIHPESNERVSLNTRVGKLTEDPQSENELFEKVNMERQKVGVGKLVWDNSLVVVGRDHARDMWMRSYFGHYSPEGDDVGDRLDSNKVDYRLAGENLALAPTVSVAHQGLMNSQGHKENILRVEFGRIGIGVIDNGVYGKMFVQVFAD